MPSDPSAKPSSSSSGSGSSSSRPSGSSSSSSSSSKPSAPTSGDAKPPQATPVISANAWMSFFLFCCLVLIILQAPLGLTGNGITMGATTIFGLPAVPWGAAAAAIPGQPVLQSAVGMWGGMPGCAGYVAGYVPWCQYAPPGPPAYFQPMLPPPQPQPIVTYSPPPQVYVDGPPRREHEMGGQGQIATPGGGAGWSWYANPDASGGGYRVREPRPYKTVQYQRPGVQVQVQTGPRPVQQQQQQYQQAPALVQTQDPGPRPEVLVSTPPLVPPVVPVLPPPAAAGLANLENAFYPLLIAAVALLVVFDYAS